MKVKTISWLVAMIIICCIIADRYFVRHPEPSMQSGMSESVTGPAMKRVFQYLGREITLPGRTKRIVVTGALEALEDLMALKVKPVGAMTIGGTFPPLFAEITQQAVAIGEKTQPNFEAILKLKPDVIVSSDKFPEAVNAKLCKIAPTIPLSHFSEDGEANLRLLGELTGAKEQAEALTQKYQQDLAAAKVNLSATVKRRKVVVVRIRTGNIILYPANMFFNEILYGQLGLTIPEEIKKVKKPEIVALERFSEVDPDYLFVQYEVSESPSQPRVMEELRRNPIWRSLKAVRNEHVFVNVVDPLIQGVAIGGKVQFLNAAVAKLVQ
jgi:iron complex transport system substrate-binding protein